MVDLRVLPIGTKVSTKWRLRNTIYDFKFQISKINKVGVIVKTISYTDGWKNRDRIAFNVFDKYATESEIIYN